MKSIVLLGYELLTVIVPAFIVMLAFLSARRRRGIGSNGRHMMLLMIFALYVFVVLNVTGAGTVFDLKRYGLEIRPEQINVLPFSDPNLNIVTHGLNVILFIPFGLLFPLIRGSKKSFACTLAGGALLSLIIELSQLLNNRSTDIDDLIMNTVGTAAGFALYVLFFRKSTSCETPQGFLRYEPCICLAVMIICRFLFFNEMGAAKLLYVF